MTFKTSYKRPNKLSDPYCDFTEGMLQELLATNDDAFGYTEYLRLFGPHLPAGTYEEVMYFLPQGFDYLKTHEDEALDLAASIFGFCSKNFYKLEDDSLVSTIEREILDCLNYWTRDFRVIHYDKAACRKNGWRTNYFDYVTNTETICQATSDLVEFSTFSDLAVQFAKSLAHHNGDVIKASWFLEYSRSRFDVYTPPETDEMNDLLTNKKFLHQAYKVVWSEAMNSNVSPTYWQDTFNALSL